MAMLIIALFELACIFFLIIMYNNLETKYIKLQGKKPTDFNIHYPNQGE